MERDSLQRTWDMYAARLDRSFALDERLLREALAARVRRSVRPSLAMRLLEAALGAAALALVAPHVVARPGDAWMLLLGALVVVFLAVFTALAIAQFVLMTRLDDAAPLVEQRRRVARAAAIEYGALQWALLGGTLLWLPLPVLVLEALSGADLLGRIPPGYLVANLAVGVAFAAAVRVWAKAHLERSDPRPWARRFVDGLLGHGLRAARRELAELERYSSQDDDAGDRPRGDSTMR